MSDPRRRIIDHKGRITTSSSAADSEQTDVWECPQCGAFVADKGKHAEFHQHLGDVLLALTADS